MTGIRAERGQTQPCRTRSRHPIGTVDMDYLCETSMSHCETRRIANLVVTIAALPFPRELFLPLEVNPNH